jgi:hypothetical protein
VRLRSSCIQVKDNLAVELYRRRIMFEDSSRREIELSIDFGSVSLDARLKAVRVVTGVDV